MTRAVIVSAARTPFGTMGGSLKDIAAVDLGAHVIREALKRADLPGDIIDNVLMGMVIQGGVGQVPSRQASIKAGLPVEVTSETINKVCASGMRAVSLGETIIRAGDADVIIAGGMESMSNAPFALKKARFGYRMGNDSLLDLMVNDGLWCAFHNVHMAVHGSTVAKEYGVSREDQDAFAFRSQQLASKAIEEGKFAEEIAPLEIPQRKGDSLWFTVDEGPRRDTTLAKLNSLPPIFVKDGTVTAGNAPGVNDGAGAMVLMSEEKAREMGKKPLATILGHASVAQEPAYIATTPGLAINKLLKQKGMTIQDVDLIEANEAFAAVALTSQKIAKWDPSKVNVNGGAIALGHPIGASGARVIMTLIYELRRRGGGIGIAAICSGAAQGDAIMLEIYGA
ncbi:acetyl-CoA C-acetyltransferase [Desulfosporosinus sp. BICA1-9]|uniref:acetyl-CoA C-acetyltransferase n=1 Tax=Desulfosporosinus sp. BICA1-9 TaxID=1531958 RepID=UPI00054BEF71|nr:acetyl-CoA C-acetyltransferase [Desulfosporosinus sp. BICA1-9]KJS50096.1 MAG: acetyl-CoA acetyltransferase [Peptococcaceae bacterium BRH_c23]KJS89830.1 MAG: acetyl-CoA acetyltransferase [Desulfosporosinus sp. BICA1-9]